MLRGAHDSTAISKCAIIFAFLKVTVHKLVKLVGVQLFIEPVGLNLYCYLLEFFASL